MDTTSSSGGTTGTKSTPEGGQRQRGGRRAGSGRKSHSITLTPNAYQILEQLYFWDQQERKGTPHEGAIQSREAYVEALLAHYFKEELEYRGVRCDD